MWQYEAPVQATSVTETAEHVFGMGSSKEGEDIVAKRSTTSIEEVARKHKEFLNRTLYLEERLVQDIEREIKQFSRRIGLMSIMKRGPARACSVEGAKREVKRGERRVYVRKYSISIMRGARA